MPTSEATDRGGPPATTRVFHSLFTRRPRQYRPRPGDGPPTPHGLVASRTGSKISIGCWRRRFAGFFVERTADPGVAEGSGTAD